MGLDTPGRDVSNSQPLGSLVKEQLHLQIREPKFNSVLTSYPDIMRSIITIVSNPLFCPFPDIHFTLRTQTAFPICLKPVQHFFMLFRHDIYCVCGIFIQLLVLINLHKSTGIIVILCKMHCLWFFKKHECSATKIHNRKEETWLSIASNSPCNQ